MDFWELDRTIGRVVLQHIQEFHYFLYSIEAYFLFMSLILTVLSIFPSERTKKSLQIYVEKLGMADYLYQGIFSLFTAYVFTFERTVSLLKFFPLACGLFFISLAAWEWSFNSPIKRFLKSSAPAFLKCGFFGIVVFLHYNITTAFYHFSKFPFHDTIYVVIIGGLLSLVSMNVKDMIKPLVGLSEDNWDKVGVKKDEIIKKND